MQYEADSAKEFPKPRGNGQILEFQKTNRDLLLGLWEIYWGRKILGRFSCKYANSFSKRVSKGFDWREYNHTRISFEA